MTRLSDSLRGLADRAPIEGATLSSVSASRRIRRNRRMRAAANATVGVGAAAVVALAAMNPTMGGAGKSSPDLAAAPGAPERGTDENAALDFGGAESMLAWAWCGSRPFDTDVPSASDLFTLTLGEVSADVEPGATLEVGVTIGLPDARETGFSSTGPSFLLLWDGVVVGMGQANAEIVAQELSDDTATWDGEVAMVNCWDGTALPAGDYELVAYQDFYEQASEAPDASPSETPAVEPSLAPVDPSQAPADEPAVRVAPAEVPGIAADGATLRAVSEPVAFAIAGERVENPFGQYLDPIVEPVPYPDGYLDPATARAEFATHVTNKPWDMAEGTQRVVKSSDSLTDADPNAWVANYYGCPVDNAAGPSFPATSAEWSLIDVEATLPDSLDLKYGWIVDNNPEVQFSVTNVSEYTLPGFWGQPSTSLYLVKDGKVVAQAYLPSVDPNSYNTLESQDGMLDPGATLGGKFVWRDINGCWIGNTATTIASGTYTVLALQDIYMDNGGAVMYVDPLIEGTASSFVEDGAKEGLDATDAARSYVAPGPDGGTYDSVGFQVWTSLGRITVS